MPIVPEVTKFECPLCNSPLASKSRRDACSSDPPTWGSPRSTHRRMTPPRLLSGRLLTENHVLLPSHSCESRLTDQGVFRTPSQKHSASWSLGRYTVVMSCPNCDTPPQFVDVTLKSFGRLGQQCFSTRYLPQVEEAVYDLVFLRR